MAKVHYYLQNNSGNITTICSIEHCNNLVTSNQDEVTCQNCLRIIKNYGYGNDI